MRQFGQKECHPFFPSPKSHPDSKCLAVSCQGTSRDKALLRPIRADADADLRNACTSKPVRGTRMAHFNENLVPLLLCFSVWSGFHRHRFAMCLKVFCKILTVPSLLGAVRPVNRAQAGQNAEIIQTVELIGGRSSTNTLIVRQR